MAVDGPQGPAHQTKPGIVYTAREARAKIIPLALEARRGVILSRRWDRHCIPLPFNNITVFIGKSIDVEPGDSLEAKGAEVTTSLLQLTKQKGKVAFFSWGGYQEAGKGRESTR